MRIEIRDGMGYAHQIDSGDLDLIGRWFTEKARLILSADTRINHPALIDIWPTTEEERQLIPSWHEPRRLTQTDILALAEHLTRVSFDLGERERCPG